MEGGEGRGGVGREGVGKEGKGWEGMHARVRREMPYKSKHGCKGK